MIDFQWELDGHCSTWSHHQRLLVQKLYRLLKLEILKTEAPTDTGEVAGCEDVPTPPLVPLMKREPMSPEEVELDMKAQVAAMVQATLEKMQSDGVITVNATDSDKV